MMNETSAAAMFPVTLPRPEFTAGCIAISPPVTAISATAIPRSIRHNLMTVA